MLLFLINYYLKNPKYSDASLFVNLAKAKDYWYKNVLNGALDKLKNRNYLLGFDNTSFNFVRRG